MPHTDLPLTQHAAEIQANRARWDAKPSLRASYESFYKLIVERMCRDGGGVDVEIGAGIGNFKKYCPSIVSTDLFPHPWVDRVEDAQALSFPDGSVRNIVLFDVFHHLRYPGRALDEFHRVLAPGGRVIIFEPDMGLLARAVYGLAHHEPLGFDREITWTPPAGAAPLTDYYAAQGNAYRIFVRGAHRADLAAWRGIETTRLAAWSYLCTGGFAGPNLCPMPLFPLFRALDRLLGLAPSCFSSRLLVVLTR